MVFWRSNIKADGLSRPVGCGRDAARGRVPKIILSELDSAAERHGTSPLLATNVHATSAKVWRAVVDPAIRPALDEGNVWQGFASHDASHAAGGVAATFAPSALACAIAFRLVGFFRSAVQAGFVRHKVAPCLSNCTVQLDKHYPTANYRLPSSASFTSLSASLFCARGT